MKRDYGQRHSDHMGLVTSANVSRKPFLSTPMKKIFKPKFPKTQIFMVTLKSRMENVGKKNNWELKHSKMNKTVWKEQEF